MMVIVSSLGIACLTSTLLVVREIGKYSKGVYFKKYRKELFINRLMEELNKLANHNS